MWYVVWCVVCYVRVVYAEFSVRISVCSCLFTPIFFFFEIRNDVTGVYSNSLMEKGASLGWFSKNKEKEEKEGKKEKEEQKEGVLRVEGEAGEQICFYSFPSSFSLFGKVRLT